MLPVGKPINCSARSGSGLTNDTSLALKKGCKPRMKSYFPRGARIALNGIVTPLLTCSCLNG